MIFQNVSTLRKMHTIHYIFYWWVQFECEKIPFSIHCFLAPLPLVFIDPHLWVFLVITIHTNKLFPILSIVTMTLLKQLQPLFTKIVLSIFTLLQLQCLVLPGLFLVITSNWTFNLKKTKRPFHSNKGCTMCVSPHVQVARK